MCVEKIPDAKDYVIFHFVDRPKTVGCVLSEGKYFCCGEGSFGDTLVVTFVLKDNTKVDKAYTVVQGEVNGFYVVKLMDRYTATITVEGEGNALIVEDIPKDFVESASEIISDAMIVEFDPVIAWFVSLKDGVASVSYTVRRGTIPQTLPSVSLSECNLEIRPVKSEVFRKDNEMVFLFQFEVLFNGERVIPPHVDAEVLGKRAEYKIVPEEEVLELLSYVGESPTEIPVEVSVRVGNCRASYAELVIPKKEEVPVLLVVATVVVLIALAYLAYRKIVA